MFSNSNGSTPLHIAAGQSHNAVVAYLLTLKGIAKVTVMQCYILDLHCMSLMQLQSFYAVDIYNFALQCLLETWCLFVCLHMLSVGIVYV